MTDVLRLDADARESTPGAVGGKGAALARLAGLGLRVPPGIALSTAVFRRFLAGAGAAGAAAEAVPRPHAAELPALRERLARAPVPAEARAAVLAAWRGWTRELGAGRIIVRSSATVEDGGAHSFAGVFESLPIATEDELDDALRRVWGSVFEPRALAYFRMAGVDAVPEMALVVQPFVEADRSGVMFTRFADPEGRQRLLIEHVEGDCEKLVAGSVDPERLWLDPAAPALSADGSLPADAVRSLLRAAKRVEEAFGGAQDVEWCLAGGEVFVLQSRPITTGPAAAGSPASAAEDSREALLAGLGASPGRGSGSAQLVFHIEHADALQPGQVLVTPMTNPDMVTAMGNSAGIVTDVGGMICHAAIVARELGVPCVVGTGRATSVVAAGDPLTVDGFAGRVFAGLDRAERREVAPDLEWPGVWRAWMERRGVETPLVTVVDALEHLPEAMTEVAFAPWLELSVDERLRPVVFAGLEPAERERRLTALLRRAVERLPRTDVELLVRGDHLAGAEAELEAAVAQLSRVRLAAPSAPRPVPLGRALRAADEACAGAAAAAGGGDAVFGTPPAVHPGPMPDPLRRRRTHELLPALAAAHADAAPSPGEPYPWVDPRPEIVISPMLKSIVFPGLELVPTAMGFGELEPMHVKWRRCRFTFRADTFGAVWGRLQQASWDPAFLGDLLDRTRSSYRRLADAAAAFPADDEALRATAAAEFREIVLSWWNAFAEFFSLSFFIQAQGDDCMAPHIVAATAANQESSGPQTSLPGVAALIAPTTPVRTAEYMADLSRVRAALEAAGCATVEAALAALESDAELRTTVEGHVARWFWMRERDPFFEPLDSLPAVLAKALGSRPAVPQDYAANVARARLALGVHADLAEDPRKLVHAVSFNHDLAIERENHHVEWLESSHGFRRWCVECERRLAIASDLEAGDVFFFELPELLEAVEALPAPVDDELLARVRNRRLGWRRESQHGAPTAAEPQLEDDYY